LFSHLSENNDFSPIQVPRSISVSHTNPVEWWNAMGREFDTLINSQWHMVSHSLYPRSLL
jgi:hypothetical protein